MLPVVGVGVKGASQSMLLLFDDQTTEAHAVVLVASSVAVPTLTEMDMVQLPLIELIVTRRVVAFIVETAVMPVASPVVLMITSLLLKVMVSAPV